MGALDLAAALAHFNGLPIFSVAADQRNPLANDYINTLRSSPGIENVARGSGSLKSTVRRLRQGGMLAILPDVRLRTPGLSVPFLGGHANVATGAASLARHADVPIFPVLLTREGWARHTIALEAPILPDAALGKDDDAGRITAAVFAVIDRAIRDNPDQWFWYNKRWILDPVESKHEGLRRDRG
jgi:KDO2-lipid IV(A) lauroyltransferase